VAVFSSTSISPFRWGGHAHRLCCGPQVMIDFKIATQILYTIVDRYARLSVEDPVVAVPGWRHGKPRSYIVPGEVRVASPVINLVGREEVRGIVVCDVESATVRKLAYVADPQGFCNPLSFPLWSRHRSSIRGAVVEIRAGAPRHCDIPRAWGFHFPSLAQRRFHLAATGSFPTWRPSH